MKLSKKLLLVPVFLTAVTLGGVSATSVASAHYGQNGKHKNSPDKTIVGVWEVTAKAPYAPHLFTFHKDGTMTTTNPTNVQEDPNAENGGTNDSLGMGLWKMQKDDGQKFIVGTFEQLNAFADTHQPADKLSVSFKVKVDGDTFAGDADAKVGNAPAVDSGLTATRVMLDQDAIDQLANDDND